MRCGKAVRSGACISRLEEDEMDDDKRTVTLTGKAIGNEMVEVPLAEFRRVAALPQMLESSALQTVTEERGHSYRGLCGVRVSMGGLRLPKAIVIRATDTFVFNHHDERLMAGLSKEGAALIGRSCTFTATPEDLVPVSIDAYGGVRQHGNYDQGLFGFKVPKAIDDHSALTLQHSWNYSPGTVHSCFLGDV